MKIGIAWVFLVPSVAVECARAEVDGCVVDECVCVIKVNQ